MNYRYLRYMLEELDRRSFIQDTRYMYGEPISEMFLLHLFRFLPL